MVLIGIDPINIPQMLAYIPAPWILWDRSVLDLQFLVGSSVLLDFCLEDFFVFFVSQMRTMVLEYESQHLPKINHPVM